MTTRTKETILFDENDDNDDDDDKEDSEDKEENEDNELIEDNEDNKNIERTLGMNDPRDLLTVGH